MLISSVGKRIEPGDVFGRLTVLRREPSMDKPKLKYWLCQCECGNIKYAVDARLKNGGIVSCNCFRKSVGKTFTATHGMTKGPEHRAWAKMKYRCLKPKCPSWKDYGGRGITVYPEWVVSFEAFYEYIGPRPAKGYSLDRIDNDGNYEPGNVRWTTRSVQSKNQRQRYIKATREQVAFIRSSAENVKQLSLATGLTISVVSKIRSSKSHINHVDR